MTHKMILNQPKKEEAAPSVGIYKEKSESWRGFWMRLSR
jgi:hypothetical protein